MDVMKLFTPIVFIALTSVASWAQAFQVYDIGTMVPSSYPAFAVDENTPTWGQGNQLGDAAAISYSFAESGYSCDTIPDCFSLNTFMPSGYQNAISSAFGAWAAVSDLSFTQVADQSGNIVIGGEIGDGASGQLGHAGIGISYSHNGLETISHIANAYIHFDNAENWSISSHGRPLFDVALHEIGHALGLDHSSDVNAVMYSMYTGTNSLQVDDINGIQYLYGASTVSPIPEPSTYLLFLLGLAMVAGYGRKAVIKQA